METPFDLPGFHENVSTDCVLPIQSFGDETSTQMAEKTKCIICRKHLPKTKPKTRLDRKINRQQQIFSSWKGECAVSLCEILFGCPAKPFYQYFRLGEFCDPCLDAVRDINFTWKQIKTLKNRMLHSSAKIQKCLKTNYETIELKNETQVVEERASAALNVSGTELHNFLENYSYDEITEILYTATSRQSISALFSQIMIKEDPHSFAGDYESGILPLEVKLEFGEEQFTGVMTDGSDEEFTKSDSDDSSNETDPDLFSSSTASKRRRMARAARRSTFNNSEMLNEKLSADESSEEHNILDSEGGESHSDDSWSPKQSQRGSPSKKLPTKAKQKRKRRTKSASAKSKEKRSKKQKIKDEPKRSKLECPTCHKMLSRQCFLSHQRTHTGEKPFTCEVCGKAFNEQTTLWKHSQKQHAKLNPLGTKIKKPAIAVKAANELASRGRMYHCDMCSWKFNWKYRYLRHLKDTHLNQEIKDGDSFNFHYCDEEGCLLSFTSLSSLKTHILEAHSSEDKKISVFECTVCQRIFSQQESLNSHAKSHKEYNFGCAYCPMTFPTRNEMEEHKPRHEIVFQLSMYRHLCEECGERFADHYQLRKHIANLHVNTTIKVRRKLVSNLNDKNKIREKYFCNICQKPVYTISRETHMYSHTYPNGIKCSMCPKVLRTPKLVKFHEQRAHKINSGKTTNSTSDNKTVCHVCQQEVYTHSLEFHLQNHFHPNGFQCSNCPAIELTPELLQIHQKIAHPCTDKPKKKSTQRKPRRVICPVCQKMTERHRLQTHMYIHSHPEGFKCPYCPAVMKTPKLIQHHQIRAHPPDQCDLPPKFMSNISRCESCNKTFDQRKKFHHHLVRHHPEDYQTTHPYACNFCFSVFTKEEDRNSHIERTHNSFLCSFEGCGKRFRQRVKLVAHLNIHYQRKPYECPHCGKGFANEANCRSHVLMVHTKHRSVRCKLCPDNIGFYVKKEFCKHAQNAHPEIPESEYTSILERRKPDVPVKVIKNKMLEEFDCYPAHKRKMKVKEPKN